jgi:lipopolysaccharide/colanic/teichoic acid biosynthesis glycosyltransferase
MVADAERRCGPVWATRNDPRITRVGRFLRRSRIDEVPQLFNVLKGDMVLVGPRPERPCFVKKLCEDVPDYEKRFVVKPGVTGLAQVRAGYDSSIDDVRNKLSWDLRYIADRRISKDVAVLLRTITVVLLQRGT